MEAARVSAELATVESYFTTILVAPPSCVEFSKDAAYPRLVIGTYSLEESAHSSIGSQTRSGSLVVYKFDESSLIPCQTLETSSAVLDLKFSPKSTELMAVALSTGLIELYCMHLGRLSEYSLLSKEESDGAQRGRVRVSEPSILVLSLAWHPNVPAVIAASLSNGNIVLVDCSKDISIRQIEAHSLEAWTVSWSPNVSHLQRQDELTLFSGGDDSTLRTFGKPLEEQAKSPDDPVKLRPILFPDARIHGAGITAILPLQLWKDIEDVEDEVLLTGSYDEHIRVLLLGPNRRWKVAAEERLGGGVWRLSMMSRSQIREKASNMGASFQILASCMHAGARVLNVFLSSDETWSIKIIAKFEEHESMNYGSDALVWDGHIAGGDTPFTVASTSFYDRKLCLWKAPNTNATHPAVGQ